MINFFKDARDYQILFLSVFLFLGVTNRDWTLQLNALLFVFFSCLVTQIFLSSIVNLFTKVKKPKEVIELCRDAKGKSFGVASLQDDVNFINSKVKPTPNPTHPQPLPRGYRVHTNNQENKFSGFRPPSPRETNSEASNGLPLLKGDGRGILGGTRQESPPGLGDLGGRNALNISQLDLCVHGSVLTEGYRID